MALKEGDLKNVVLKRLSVDEFEPKTGDAKDVLVLGFQVTESNVGDDLYGFLNGALVEIRDIEVSPNPNDNGFYMVFVELDRNEKVVETIKTLLRDTERLAGKLNWEAKTYLNDDYLPLAEDEIYQYIITDPSKYVTREEFEANRAVEEAKRLEEEQRVAAEATAQDASNKILEFLRDSNLLQAGINEGGRLVLQDSRNVIALDIVDFGNSTEVMSKHGIQESAIKFDFDKVLFGKLKSMLGEMAALPIDQYIVIYNPSKQDNILIAKAT
jgi:hypothetical protein